MFQKVSRYGIRVGSCRWVGAPLLFGPALFFLALGLAVLVAPKLVLGVLAGFLLFLGIALLYLAIRFMQFRSRFEQAVQDIQSKVQIQAVHFGSGYEFEEEQEELRPSSSGKIIVH